MDEDISQYSKKMKQYLENIHLNLDIVKLDFPLKENTNQYFPDYVAQLLDDYIKYYNENLLKHIDHSLPTVNNARDGIVSKINFFIKNLKEVISLYFQGKVYQATLLFNNTLDTVVYDFVKNSKKIEIGKSFYRARISDIANLNKKDLFHVSFENRHLVSTNRYSIPGFPALYLGDATYTCWEELNRPKLRNVWFSRFENTKPLTIIQLERLGDFLSSLEGGHEPIQIIRIINYLLLHPLTLLCSIKVRHSNGNFKPEYIIPQLLLQYVSQNEEIDGIMFPSTKINYKRVEGFSSYNYVFPVKSINPTGHCNILTNIFHCTEPTSLELEEIINNLDGTVSKMPPIDEGKKIEIINGIKSGYHRTSFGKIENKLIKRQIGVI